MGGKGQAGYRQAPYSINPFNIRISLHCTCLSHNHNSAAPSAPLHGNRPPTAQPHCSPTAHLLLPRQRLPHGSLPLHHPPPSAAPVAPILTSGPRISGLMVWPHSSHPCTIPSSPLPTSSNPSPVCLPTSSALHLLLQHWFLARISRPCSTMQAEAADVAEVGERRKWRWRQQWQRREARGRGREGGRRVREGSLLMGLAGS
ncbi:unnamed protein product [Closterium sp. Naga37s-1]|nr:unnamed protein product [Closterium sp. Naga37s-1]